LSETYERMIGTIPEDLLPAAMRLLQFLVQAPRRLTVPEAIDVIATDTTTDPGGFDEDSRVFRDNEVLRFCPSLLSIVEVSESQSRGSQLWGVTRKELHLAHFSVKEFLMLRADFQQPACGVVITMTCLAYLGGIKGHYRQLDEEAFWGETFDRDSLNRDYPMARLAAEIWTTHAAWAQSHDSVFQATLAFLEDHDMFQRWGRLYQADHPSARNLGPPRGSLLYYACLAGLTRVAHELVDRGAEVNVRAGHFGTPLQAACYGGHGGIVQLLIERGADVSAVEGYLGTALQAASFGGHINVAKLLLEKGVDVNVQTGMYGNALQAASWQGHADIVKLLLQEGADVNAVGGLYGTALQAASDGGHTEVVGLLLKEGANVSARVYRCGNALYAASQGGHADIVKILLEFGADVSKGTDGVWGDPLAVALQQGRVDIVRLLIRAGAQIENDPFYAGLVGHSEDSVRLLLEKARADVDAGNRSFRSETVYYDPHVYHYAPPSASWDGIDRLPPGQSVEMDDL
jgi:ankyrin repeat protein